MMRELRVEDALLYLDQVKMEFGDRPHIYNEFLDIMKTFKTQQIDTPGVIRRVSNLFQGNKKLVLGFNTFLPEGYKIELPMDGEGPPVALFRPPGTKKYHVLSGPGTSPVQPAASQQLGGPPGGAVISSQPPTMMSQQGPGPVPARAGMPPHSQQSLHHGPPQLRQSTSGGPPHPHAQHPSQTHNRAPQQSTLMGQQSGGMVVDQSSGVASFQHQNVQMQHAQQQQQQQQGVSRAQQGQGQSLSGEGMARLPIESVARSSNQSHLGRPPHLSQGGMSGIGAPQMSGQEGNGASAPVRMAQAPHQAQGVATHPRVMPAGGHPHQMHPGPPQEAQVQPPVEFDHAINYVTTIKKRFAAEPETYKKFLEILHTYQKEQRGIKEVLDEVSVLFADHPDLLKEFTYFLPDAVQAQAKAQLDQVAKESEARKRAASSKQAIMQTAQGMQKQAQVLSRPAQPGVKQASGPQSSVSIPFGATQGRSDEREREIVRSAMYGKVSFAPVKPPRRIDLTPAQAAQRNGRPTVIPPVPRQPTTSEAAFFEKVKNHLNRKELAPDKPPGSRRHTPYTEFLKCLHLFGAAVLNKDELLLLLRGLFVQGHAPKSGANAGGGASNPLVVGDAHTLLRDFEEIFIGRGPYADQETALKDKSKYGSIMTRDFDFSHCERPTPSYCTYPTDYPRSLFLSNSGQIENPDTIVLNNSVVCIGPERSSRSPLSYSPESYDGVRFRRNAYEEALFKVEDERFEVDMAIERNALTMREIEPMAEEATRLRDIEEKDGQPIGRLQYQLQPRTLNSTHINSIARVYGDHGDEVLQHLSRNPLVVLPIVYQRLRQKDGEWRAAKNEMWDRWNAVVNANYEGSLDVTCHFYRKEIERCFAVEQLRQECQRTRLYVKHPSRLTNHPAAVPFLPEFSLSSSDPDAVLYQPFITMRVRNDVPLPHKDAFQLLSEQVNKHSARSKLDRERVGRIWAEFVVPWFGFETNTVLAEVRDSFVGSHATSVVKYAVGQQVKTAFGEGTVTAVIDGSSSLSFRYRVKLAFGIGFIRPSAIIHKMPEGKGNPIFVRRGGVMEKVAREPVENDQIGSRFQLLFATQSTYLFIRLYCLLIKVLVDIRENLRTSTPTSDPSKSYYNPKKAEKRHDDDRLKHDYQGILMALRRLISRENGMNTKEFERFCRTVSKENVHQMAILPKLVEKCSESLVSVAREDVILQLFDYCCSKEADPIQLRAECLSVSRSASYRIQFDLDQGCHHFSYIPEGEELLTSLPEKDERRESFGGDRPSKIGDWTDGDVMMDRDEMVDRAESQPMELANGGEGDDMDAAFEGPQTKRPKLK